MFTATYIVNGESHDVTFMASDVADAMGKLTSWLFSVTDIGFFTIGAIVEV
jgi:hypothetical protein